MTVIDRRTWLRTFAVGLASISLGRVVSACFESDPDASSLNNGTGGAGNGSKNNPVPTDQDEHVPGTSKPVEATTDAPKVPVASWESRVKQLEAEQLRQYSRASFARGDAGVWTGKENSHEPRASILKEGNLSRVEVKVEHVMGSNLLDSGTPAVIPDAAAEAAAARDAAMEAGNLDAGNRDAAAATDASTLPITPAPAHYITTIYIRAMVDGIDRVVGLWEFASTDAAPPTVRFTLPAGVTEVVAYEWCTLHGLWKAPPLAIT